MAIVCAERDAPRVTEQPDTLALGAVGPQPCSICPHQTDVGIAHAAHCSLPALLDLLVGLSQLLDLGGGLLRRHAGSVPDVFEGAVVVSLPGLPALLSALFPLGDLLSPGEPNLVQGVHFILPHGLVFFGGGQLDDGVDTVAFALTTENLFRVYRLGPVGRESHD